MSPLAFLIICLSINLCYGFSLHRLNRATLAVRSSATRSKPLSCYIETQSEQQNPNSTDSSQVHTEQSLQLDISLLKPFFDIAVPFFKEDETARSSLLGVFALTLLNSGVSVAFSYISRDFYNALNVRDEAVFYEKIELFFAALLIAVPITVYYRFLREKLSIYWREALTEKVLNRYYSYRIFYQLETLREVDNPDQRISEDVRHFTKTSLDFCITLFTSFIDLLSFSAVLFQIYPGLFVAIVMYAGLGSVVTTQLGQSLVGLNYEKLQREANFRFALIRTRENAEAIAFYDSDAKKEKSALWSMFKEVLETQLGIVIAQRNLEVFTTSYRYLVQILPSLIVAPLYFAKKVELGTISQSYGAFNHILGDFSIIINQFEALSAFSAGLTRLTTFLEKIETGGWGDLPPSPLPFATSRSRGDGDDGSLQPKIPVFSLRRMSTSNKFNDIILDVRNLTLLTPDAGRILVGAIRPAHSDALNTTATATSATATNAPSAVSDGENIIGVDFKLRRGDRVLVVGPSGAGKSSFVRAVSGLWRVGFGEVTWFENNNNNNEQEKEQEDILSPKREGEQAVDVVAHTVTSCSCESPPAEVFFLPQKPYNVLGSLRDQIIYPSNVLEATANSSLRDLDQRLLDILKSVNLGPLASRVGKGCEFAGLETIVDWSKQLSLGEQQRLAFARVVYNKPAVIFLDEATSALDLEAERAMYILLEDMNATYVSIGHRPSLLKFHSTKLVVAPESALLVETIDQSSAAVDAAGAIAMMEFKSGRVL